MQSSKKGATNGTKRKNAPPAQKKEGNKGAPPGKLAKKEQNKKANQDGSDRAKTADFIDGLFEAASEAKAAKAAKESTKPAKRHPSKSGNPFIDGQKGPSNKWAWADEVKPKRFDEDGLPIYTYESLRIGKGGGTADCPFDCDCCF
ncbi:unnamed protein product [Chrysoparadoxa australica]